MSFAYSQRSNNLASVWKVFTTGWLFSVMLNSISVWPLDHVGHSGVIFAGSKWWLASRKTAVDRNACSQALMKAVLLKVTGIAKLWLYVGHGFLHDGEYSRRHFIWEVQSVCSGWNSKLCLIRGFEIQCHEESMHTNLPPMLSKRGNSVVCRADENGCGLH